MEQKWISFRLRRQHGSPDSPKAAIRRLPLCKFDQESYAELRDIRNHPCGPSAANGLAIIHAGALRACRYSPAITSNAFTGQTTVSYYNATEHNGLRDRAHETALLRRHSAIDAQNSADPKTSNYGAVAALRTMVTFGLTGDRSEHFNRNIQDEVAMLSLTQC